MTRRGPRVAVLGAGIMGSSLALFLARRGIGVTVFDRADAVVSGASRWNEGKIHLGYLYGADPTLRTARHVIPGGLHFGRLVADLVGCDLAAHTTADDDVYLIHRHSVVGAQALRAQFEAVSALIREHPDAHRYLVDVSTAHASPLSPREVRALADAGEIVAGFRVPERSVNTGWVADRLVDALADDPLVTVRTGTTITGVSPVDTPDGPWRVRGEPDLDEQFDVVVNALWNGRLQIDLTAGVTPSFAWSNRYRLSLFVRTEEVVDTRSAIVAVGPFGDVKNYDGREFYLSWYPVGLRAESDEVTLPEPAPLSEPERAIFIRDVRAGLEAVMPQVGRIFDAAERITIAGGYVYAQGRGSIGDPASQLHRRDRFGVERRGRYFSVDTGKYSTAPWLASVLAQEIAGG